MSTAIEKIKEYIDINYDCIENASEETVKIRARARIQAFEVSIQILEKEQCEFQSMQKTPQKIG